MVIKLKEGGKKVKNPEKKTFCLCAFTWEEEMSLIKKGLFYAKFFEFQEFSHPSFFVGSIQPQQAVAKVRNKQFLKGNKCSSQSVYLHQA